jgi:dTDP-4-dehydrorhamnose 3,5-epimerase
MQFVETGFPGCRLIRTEPFHDARGAFTRSFCAREFRAQGISPVVAQTSYSQTKRRGALRGLHFQAAPALEAKLVRCLRGAIFDVMVDLRPASATRGRWFGCELSATNELQLHAAEGFAHGFQALADDVLVAYQISQFYDPARARAALGRSRSRDRLAVAAGRSVAARRRFAAAA